VARGRVVGLGDNLELLLEGRSEPITAGRLIVAGAEDEIDSWASEAPCGTGARSFSEETTF